MTPSDIVMLYRMEFSITIKFGIISTICDEYRERNGCSYLEVLSCHLLEGTPVSVGSEIIRMTRSAVWSELPHASVGGETRVWRNGGMMIR
jgi:hypothetical protein